MNKIQAKEIIGGDLSATTKMPCKSFNLPAWECKTGSKLAKIPGTVCHGCYAMKGNYTRFPSVKKAQYKRLDQLFNPAWVDAMVSLIEKENNLYFRWHDAGDVQSHQHMAKIIEVCKLTPDTKHWMPTQERQYLPAPEEVPDNLIIRLSAAKVDGTAGNAWSHSSTVVTDGSPSCPAPTQGGKCKECRACWNKDIKNVSYGKH